MYSDRLPATNSPVSTTSRRRPATRPPPSWSPATRSAPGATSPAIAWYTAFAYFKLAVILEGIHYRYTLGQTVGAGFDRIGDAGPGLHRAGPGILDTLGTGRQDAPPWTSPSTPGPRSCAAGCSPSWTSTSTRPSRSSREQRAAAAEPWSAPPPVVEELQGRGARARAVEPVPARRARRRADQPAVRAARRDHRPQPAPGAGRAQLRGPGHREHGGARRVRHRRAAASSGWSRCSTARSAPRSR